MALQGSGPISLSDVQTEFGGSNPISISEYYGVDTVPGSGTISMSDFYGTSNADVTPDEAFWTGIAGPGNDTESFTFTGINQTITIELTSIIIYGTLRYRINSGSYSALAGTVQTSISNNDVLTIEFTDVAQSGTSSLSGTVTMTNESDGGASLPSLAVSTYANV